MNNFFIVKFVDNKMFLFHNPLICLMYPIIKGNEMFSEAVLKVENGMQSRT